MQIEAITFDIDDTLWDNVPVMQQLEQEMYTWLEQQVGRPLEVDITDLAWRRMEYGATLAGTPRFGDVTYVREQVTHQLLTEHGVTEPKARELAQTATEVMLELRHRVTPFPEVEGLLTQLSQHYRLAVITNGNVDVNQLSIARHFDVIFKAGELGMPKPDPAIFRHTLEKLGNIAPQHAMHVGDSWTSDVEPSAALGMQAVWIDVLNEGQAPTPAHNIHRISHVRELPEVLKALGQPLQ